MQIFKEPATVSFSPPGGKRETEAFHWIRKEWEFGKWVSRVNFSYNDGFSVIFCVPVEWSDEQLIDVMVEAKSAFNDKFQ